jgi:hypothetical protein
MGGRADGDERGTMMGKGYFGFTWATDGEDRGAAYVGWSGKQCWSK